MKCSRITIEPDKREGVPCIRGLRIPVATRVALVASRLREDEILRDYPDLKKEDRREALMFAAEAVRERETPIVFEENRIRIAPFPSCNKKSDG
jgi:uncharacterized protein (DUF433 family)